MLIDFQTSFAGYLQQKMKIKDFIAPQAIYDLVKYCEL